MTAFDDAFEHLPLVAILRGLEPGDAEAVGDALVDAGFRLIEIPLNSPEPLESIGKLATRYGDEIVIGAGTVLSPDAARDVVVHGGRLVVMPHGDPAVIEAARKAGAWCIPGAATPTEAFAAFAAGADAVKLFPGEALPPAVLKSWRSVFPPEMRLLPVGGVGIGNMADYVHAGASGFGIGSALFRAGKSAEDVAADALAFVDAWREIEH
jgi:2-dehydro-3-deoxyphosphogalactonate aldolase